MRKIQKTFVISKQLRAGGPRKTPSNTWDKCNMKL